MNMSQSPLSSPRQCRCLRFRPAQFRSPARWTRAPHPRVDRDSDDVVWYRPERPFETSRCHRHWKPEIGEEFGVIVGRRFPLERLQVESLVQRRLTIPQQGKQRCHRTRSHPHAGCQGRAQEAPHRWPQGYCGFLQHSTNPDALQAGDGMLTFVRKPQEQFDGQLQAFAGRRSHLGPTLLFAQ